MLNPSLVGRHRALVSIEPPNSRLPGIMQPNCRLLSRPWQAQGSRCLSRDPPCMHLLGRALYSSTIKSERRPPGTCTKITVLRCDGGCPYTAESMHCSDRCAPSAASISRDRLKTHS